MALTMKELEKLVKNAGFKYFRDPDRDALMLSASGPNGRYQFVILLEVQGQFIQFRTISYHHCPADHTNLQEVLKVLGDLNYKLRLVKFGWDHRDGEIVAYADVWVMDGTLTQKQFERMLHNYLPALDLNINRIKQAMETGKDPGATDLKSMLEGLPPALRDKIKELAEREKKERAGKKKDKPEVVEVI